MTTRMMVVVIHLRSAQKFDEIFRSIILKNRQLNIMLFILLLLLQLLMFEQVSQFDQKC